MMLLLGCSSRAIAIALHEAAQAVFGSCRLFNEPLDAYFRPAKWADEDGVAVLLLPGLDSELDGMLELRLATEGLNRVRLAWLCDSVGSVLFWPSIGILTRMKLSLPTNEMIEPFASAEAFDLLASRVVHRLVHDEVKNVLVNYKLQLILHRESHAEAERRVERAIRILQDLRSHALGKRLGTIGDTIFEDWSRCCSLVRGGDLSGACRMIDPALRAVLACQSEGAILWSRLRQLDG